MLSHVYPGAYQSEEVFSQLISFAKDEDDFVGENLCFVLCDALSCVCFMRHFPTESLCCGLPVFILVC